MDYLEMVNRTLDLLDKPRESTLQGLTEGWGFKLKWIVNEAMQDIIESRWWLFRRKEWVFQTVAPYSTGTISGSGTAITGSGTSWSSSNVTDGLGKLRPDGESNYYPITTVDSTTTITLTDTLDADVSAGSAYEIFQDTYNLASDVAAIKSVREFATPDPVLIGTDTFMDEYQPDPTAQAPPETILYYGRSSTGLVQVRLYPIPSSVFTVRIKGYQTFSDMSADADTPGSAVIPASFHQLFVWKAFMDALDSGIADDIQMAARIERKYAARMSQLIREDEFRIGRVHRFGYWGVSSRYRDFNSRMNWPIT